MDIISFFKIRLTKVSWLIIALFSSLFIIDVISTLTVGDLLPYMEANPMYIQYGWYGIIFANVLALYVILKAYGNNKMHNRFAALTGIVYISLARIIVIINNFEIGSRVQSGEITLAMVETSNATARVTNHLIFSFGIIALPIVLNLLAYGLLCIEHKVKPKC